MRLYCDTMIWVYFYEKNAEFFPATRALFAKAHAPTSKLLASELLLAELLVQPKRKASAFDIARYRLFFQSDAVNLIPFTRDVTERFSDLRATTRVKTPDALHLALAASAEADYFITYDTRLHALTLPGIGRICPPGLVA